MQKVFNVNMNLGLIIDEEYTEQILQSRASYVRKNLELAELAQEEELYDVLYVPIERLQMSVRAQSAMKMNGFQTLLPLFQVDGKYWMGLRGFTQGVLLEVLNTVNGTNYTMRRIK